MWCVAVTRVVGAVLCLLAVRCQGSAGDRYEGYKRCLIQHAHKYNTSHAVAEFYRAQPMCQWLMCWDIRDEVRYQCMWKMVSLYQRKGWTIRQYHGKWPFVRLCGIQEPASAIFSVLNGVANAVGVARFARRVTPGSALRAPYMGMGLVAVNAWLWSTVFHSKDNKFTEMMDYFCAFTLILYLFFSFFAKLLVGQKWWKIFTVGIIFISVFLHHVYHMAFIKFDYGYNMTLNITIGAFNSVAWLWWSYNVRHGQPYVWKAACVIMVTNGLLLLEVLDFAPLWWVFDAHSLWHAGTSPLPLLWFSFCTDDSLYVTRQRLHTKPQHRDGASTEPPDVHTPRLYYAKETHPVKRHANNRPPDHV